MTSPAFATVVGPAATDSANGATAYNSIATQTEANYPLFNSWAAAAEGVLPAPSVVIKGSALFTPAAGWAFEGYSVRETWAKKWGGTTYVSMAVKRTGVALPALTVKGDLTNTLIGTLAAGYRPLSVVYASAVCGAGIFQTYTTAGGLVYIYCASGPYDLRANQVLLWSLFFPNKDLAPF